MLDPTVVVGVKGCIRVEHENFVAERVACALVRLDSDAHEVLALALLNTRAAIASCQLLTSAVISDPRGSTVLVRKLGQVNVASGAATYFDQQ